MNDLQSLITATNMTIKCVWAFHTLGSHVADQNSQMCKLSRQLLVEVPPATAGVRFPAKTCPSREIKETVS